MGAPMKLTLKLMISACTACLGTHVFAQPVTNNHIIYQPVLLPPPPQFKQRPRSTMSLRHASGVMKFGAPIDISVIASHIPKYAAVWASSSAKVARYRTERFPQGAPAPTSLRQLILSADGGDPGYPSTYGTGVPIGTGSFPTLAVYDFNSTNLYAGNIVQGSNDLIQAGHLAFLGLTRAGGTVQIASATLKAGSPTSIHIQTGDIAHLKDALNSLQNSAFDPNQAGATTCEYENVTSSADASYKAGLSFGYTNAVKINNMFSSIDSSKSTHELVKCEEVFYSVSYTPDPSSDGVIGLDSFFDPKVTADTADTFIHQGSPPLFVSNVNYGAELYMLVDSSLSSKKTEDDLTATVSYAASNISISTNIALTNDLSQMNIHVLSIGGRSSAQAGTDSVFSGGSVGPAIVQWLQNTQDFSADASGYDETALPLDYQLSYLDFTPVTETASILGDPTVGPNGIFQGSVVYFHSNGDGKNANDLLDLSIRDSSGNIIAKKQVANQQFYNNQNTATINIPPLSNQFTRSAVENGFFDLLIHPAGTDTWKFTAYLAMCYLDPNTIDQNKNVITVSTLNCKSPGGTETEVDYQYSDRVSSWRKTASADKTAGAQQHTVESLVSFAGISAVPGSAP
jgi:hypothetical protein